MFTKLALVFSLCVPLVCVCLNCVVDAQSVHRVHFRVGGAWNNTVAPVTEKCVPQMCSSPDAL